MRTTLDMIEETTERVMMRHSDALATLCPSCYFAISPENPTHSVKCSRAARVFFTMRRFIRRTFHI